MGVEIITVMSTPSAHPTKPFESVPINGKITLIASHNEIGQATIHPNISERGRQNASNPNAMPKGIYIGIHKL